MLAVVFGSSSDAFPPAPGIVVYGLIKDQDGSTVSGPNAFVVFRSGDTEIARTEIKGEIIQTENYRALLPSDMGSGLDGYRDEVIDAALPFTVEIVIGSQVFDPIESNAGLETPDQPGSALRLDFSLGSDSDMDRLPDEWELAMLSRLGFSEGDSEYTLAAFSEEGDYDQDGLTDRQEFLAGTFAYLSINSLEIKPDSIDDQGRFHISLLVVDGGIFELEASSDFKNWEPIEFWIQGADDLPVGLVDSFEASDTRVLTLVIKAEDVLQQALYRVKVR